MTVRTYFTFAAWRSGPGGSGLIGTSPSLGKTDRKSRGDVVNRTECAAWGAARYFKCAVLWGVAAAVELGLVAALRFAPVFKLGHLLAPTYDPTPQVWRPL